MIAQWRARLSDISWYMRCLNEHIARQANQEDGCKGRFWEGRFKSQALLDEKALLACMAYVDLNPIRPGLSETPETSDYTSIQERIRGYIEAREAAIEADDRQDLADQSESQISAAEVSEQVNGEFTVPLAPLAEFAGAAREGDSGLPFTFGDYLDLVDWTGRAVRPDKSGAIPEGVPPILKRLGVDAENWIYMVRHFRRHFYGYVGPAEALEQCSRALGRNCRGTGVRSFVVTFQVCASSGSLMRMS